MVIKKLNIVVAFFLLSLSVFGQMPANKSEEKAPRNVTRNDFLPLSKVKSGMKGTAWTVFSGTESTPFNVEILGLVPNSIGPRQDMLVGRISGGGADRTAVFAGMSGSPVYIDGKLVGAIAFAFPFAKEAICGITPIEQMVSIFENGDSERLATATPKKYTMRDLANADAISGFDRESAAAQKIGRFSHSVPEGEALIGQSFMPIATPISMSGFSKATIAEFTPDLLRAGLMPVAGMSGSRGTTGMKPYGDDTLIGGDSVSVELTRGDFSMAAAGTVTLREGDRVYAFGHPFLSLGNSALPMSESSVVVVIPNLNNSFKMAVSESVVGAMTQDRATGVYGKLGTAPRMIPVKLNIVTSRNKRETLNFEIANDEFLTPILINMTVFNAITANEKDLGDLTVAIAGTIGLKNTEPVRINARFAGGASARLATNSVVIPAFNLVNSRFADLDFESIDLTINSSVESKLAELQRITVDRARAKPGDTVELMAFYRTDTGKVVSQKIPFTIPRDTPFGKITLSVGDGTTIQSTGVEQQFEPRTLAELVSTINKVKKNDALYLQAKRVTTGAVIGSNELPNLPPSVLATLNTSRSSGIYKPTVESIVAEMELPVSEYIVAGKQDLEIEIVSSID
ncbi:MAG: hypothetical protein R2684_11620 [Pyrinomonadaceae bacterium]